MLALDFRYPSVTRNMGYVEWMADMMLRVPVEHVLDAPYLADRFDPKAIAARLDSMTPQRARIWFIGSDEPHNKMAYFVDAPYQVERITPTLLARWQRDGRDISLSLPALNPYIPDNFTLIKPVSPTPAYPQPIVSRPGCARCICRAAILPMSPRPISPWRCVTRSTATIRAARCCLP
ncbi:hypothetical protein O0544_03340 [Edwardsiella anguillarum]|nr:hypothetical protein [Edwardsiella anguillarum]